MVNGECVLTIPTSTNTALRTPFLYHASTRSSTRWPGVFFFLFLTVTQGTTRYPSRSQIRRRRPSSPPSGPTKHHGVRPQERRRDLPEGHSEMPPGADRAQ